MCIGAEIVTKNVQLYACDFHSKQPRHGPKIPNLKRFSDHLSQIDTLAADLARNFHIVNEDRNDDPTVTV